MTPSQWVIAALGVALAASVAGNAALTHAYLGARDDATAATTREGTTNAAAQSCSDGVQALQRAAEDLGRQGEAARAAAALAARSAGKAAQALITKPPAVPGNDCASAAAQADDWLSKRRAK